MAKRRPRARRIVPADDGRSYLFLLEAAHRSGRIGRTVVLGLSGAVAAIPQHPPSLSRSLQKFTNVFCEQGLARGGELVKKLGKVPAGELPFEGPSCGFPIVLKV